MSHELASPVLMPRNPHMQLKKETPLANNSSLYGSCLDERRTGKVTRVIYSRRSLQYSADWLHTYIQYEWLVESLVVRQNQG